MGTGLKPDVDENRLNHDQFFLNMNILPARKRYGNSLPDHRRACGIDDLPIGDCQLTRSEGAQSKSAIRNRQFDRPLVVTS